MRKLQREEHGGRVKRLGEDVKGEVLETVPISSPASIKPQPMMGPGRVGDSGREVGDEARGRGGVGRES